MEGGTSFALLVSFAVVRSLRLSPLYSVEEDDEVGPASITDNGRLGYAFIPPGVFLHGAQVS